MILSNGTIFSSIKSKFIKKQEVNGLLSSLGIKAPLSKVPLLNNIFSLLINFIKWFNSIITIL